MIADLMIQVRDNLMLFTAAEALICPFHEFLLHFGRSNMVRAFGQNVGVDEVPDLCGQTKKRRFSRIACSADQWLSARGMGRQ
jgi:hypothetical protein